MSTRIYLVGSHSTGKTTLCRYISENYGMYMMPEMARAVLARMEVPLEELRVNIELVNNFQARVVYQQLKAEQEHTGDFVSDRAFDSLAYVAEHSTILPQLMSHEPLKEYIEWVKQGTVLFIRPHKELLKEDGVRETPMWDSVLRIDGMVKLLLEQFEIPYLPVASLSMQERVRTAEFVLNKVVPKLEDQ